MSRVSHTLIISGLAVALMAGAPTASVAQQQAAPAAAPTAPPAAAAPTEPADATPPAGATAPTDDEAGMATFLDRTMKVESDGNDQARNPRSTAVGPFQFIEATFVEVVKRNFASEIAALTPAQVLALRTNRAFARKAAHAYTVENASRLAAAGIKPTFAHLRLAFLVGPAAAVRVVKVPPHTPAALVLGPAAIRANPFMARYTTAELVARAARDVGVEPSATGGITAPPRSLGKSRQARVVTPACNLAQPSCRRWLALAERRVAKGQRVGAR